MAVAAEVAPKSVTHPDWLSTVICIKRTMFQRSKNVNDVIYASALQYIIRTSYTHDFCNLSEHVPAVCSGHDPRARFCVAWFGPVWVDTVNSDGVNTVDVAAIRTTVTSYATITSSKGVDSAQAAATLEYDRTRYICIRLDLHNVRNKKRLWRQEIW